MKNYLQEGYDDLLYFTGYSNYDSELEAGDLATATTTVSGSSTTIGSSSSDMLSNLTTDYTDTEVIGDGDITDPLYLAIGTYLGAGTKTYNSGSGFWVGDDDGIYKLFIGSSSGDNLTWNGSSLNITGSLIASEVHIPDQDSTANSFHVASDGDTWWGCTETNFNADNDNANAYVLKDGTAKFQDVTLTNAVVLDSLQTGSNIDAQYLSGTMGNLTVEGSLTVSTSGDLRSGQTAYNTGTGWFFEYNSGTPRSSIGDSTGNYMTWDGSDLTVKGTILATSSEISGTDTSSFTINDDDDDVNVDLIWGRATGGVATMRYNGTTVNIDKTFTIGGDEAVVDTRQVISGNGLSGGGDLSADRTLAVGAADTSITVNADDIQVNLATTSGLSISSGLMIDDSVAGSGLAISSKVLSIGNTGGLVVNANDIAVGAGNGITVNANDVALTTPGTLTVSSSNSATGNHTHAITSSDNPGATASILASDASGHLTLVQLATDTLTDKSGGNLTISPTGDVVFDPTGNDLLPSTGYDLNIGSLSKKYLTLHAAELWVETLVAQDTIATIGGRILVGPTTSLTRDFGSADTTIYVKHNQMASGDIAYLEAGGSVEFISIDSAASAETDGYSYTVTRNKDGTGANDWYAGDAVFNTGASGDGFIDLYSLSGVVAASTAGPTIVGNIRNSATYNDWTEHWAIGNLNGVYGYGTDTYGVAFGEYVAGQPHLTVDSTNGIQIYNGTSSVIGQWDTSGNISVGSTSTEHVYITSTAVQIKDGATVYAELTGTNWTLGETTNEHIAISTTAVQIKDGANVYTNLTAGTLTLGLTSTGEYLDIDSTNGIRLYGNNTLNIELTNAGLLRVGENANSKSRLEINAGALEIINKSAGGADTTTFSLTAAGVATMTGANVRSASSGARVELLPDANTGIQVIDDAANDVFKALVGGTDVGDVIMGDEASGQYAKYDKSTGEFIVNDSPLSFQNIFGDGSDGDVTISANTTLTEDMFYNNLTVDATYTLNTGGYRIHVAGTLTVNGTISRNGNDGGVGGNGENAIGGSGAGGTAGTAGSSLADGSVKGAIDGEAGATGANGVSQISDGNIGNVSGDGTDVAKSLVNNDGTQGGKGGGRSNGYGSFVGNAYDGSSSAHDGGESEDASATVGTRTGTVFNKPNTAFASWLLYDFFPSGDYLKSAPSGTGGAGGASGATVKVNPFNAWSGGGGAGGGSGSPGGIVAIYAKEITVGGTGNIQANGGDGGAGGSSGNGDHSDGGYTGACAGGSSGGGGGAGGNGGVVLLIYSILTNNGTIEEAGGSGGAGGAGANGASDNGEGTSSWQWQSGETGATGSAGNTGITIELEV